MSKFNGIEELPEGTFHINFIIIDWYIWKYYILMDKFKMGEYKYVFFCGVINNNNNLITSKDFF